jgi:EF hand
MYTLRKFYYSTERRRPTSVPMRIERLAIVAVLLLTGCSMKPSRVSTPTWDPDGFADAILAKLDKNKDGSLAKSELAAVPGLAWGAKAIDTDKNGSLSRDELIARFALYKKMRIGLTSPFMQLTYKGQPLNGVTVTLVPEFFLEGLIEPAIGETYEVGYVYPRVAGLKPPGARVGYYRVVVESPKVKIPAKYTKAETTPLGVEVSPDSDDTGSGNIVLVLRD